MSKFLEVEQLAGRLRQQFRVAHLPELKLLCGLAFLESISANPQHIQEPYLREFVPLLATAAATSRAEEFLPEESISLGRLAGFLASQPEGVVHHDDLAKLAELRSRIEGLTQVPHVSEREERPGRIACLFVEHYFDLGLSPRGRILHLEVTASPASSKLPNDSVVIVNPLQEPDDAFQRQAKDSIAAARKHLGNRYGLPEQKRYRFDFRVDSSGARFTGDSLGVAFAVGAIAALAQQEVFQDRLRVAPDAAFSGALSPEGKLLPIDRDGLRLKILRAFHSKLKYLIIPREHLIEALKYEQELESRLPGRRLELVGVDTLDQTATDPRLIPKDRIPRAILMGKKIWQARRSALVEIILLAVLLVICARIVAPYLDTAPARVIPRSDGFEVQNRFARTLWAKKVTGCDSLFTGPSVEPCWTVADIGWKPGKEVLFGPSAKGACLSSGKWFAYSAEGESLFTCSGRICNVYPSDSISDDQPDWYEGSSIQTCDINGERVIISTHCKVYPGRGYIKIWNTSGQQIGWYMLSGTGSVVREIDIDDDGTMELLGYAFWNRLACVGFFILPVHGAHGVSPPYWQRPDSPDLRSVERGNQMRFIAFPISFDVGRFCSPGFMAGSAELTQLSQDEYRATVHEFAEAPYQFTVDYYVDRNFRCKEVKLSDNFRKKRKTLIDDGKIKDIPIDTYCDMLRDSVRYWLSPTDTTYTTEGQLRARGK